MTDRNPLEPVAWINDELDIELSHKPWMSEAWTPLYTAPPARRSLTDEEIDRITRDRWGTQLLGVMVQAHREFARAIERKITGGNDD